MKTLSDCQAEHISGGYLVNVAPVVDVVTINQLNTAVLVSAFGGAFASYQAVLTNSQANMLLP